MSETEGTHSSWEVVEGRNLNQLTSTPDKLFQVYLTLWDPMDCSPPVSFVYGDSLDTKTGVGCHFLLKGIFPTQG